MCGRLEGKRKEASVPLLLNSPIGYVGQLRAELCWAKRVRGISLLPKTLTWEQSRNASELTTALPGRYILLC